MNVAVCAALAAASLAAAAPHRTGKKELAPGERLDLNRCSAAELMRLPGVGRKRAEAIIARRERAPYRRVEDVVAVKGISARWLGVNRAHLTVGAPPPPAPLPAPPAQAPAPAPATKPPRDARAGAPR